MNITKEDDEDYTSFATKVNKCCDDFRLAELSPSNFKCLIFVQGLVSNQDAEIGKSVLNKLENEPDLTLQQIAEDCQRCVSIRQDSKNIEESGVAHIKRVLNKNKNRSPENTKNQAKNLPPSPCYGCGQVHWYKDCPFKLKTCVKCKKRGHKSTHCRSKNKNKSFVKIAKTEEPESFNIRKFVKVKILNRDVKL